jgi:hypothetical protein
VDNGLPALTGVSDTIITPGGPTVSIRGRYLWCVTGVYFGAGSPGSWSNPEVLPSLVSSTGDQVQVTAPPGCVARGPVVLEQNERPYDQSAATYITQTAPTDSQIRLFCAGKTVIGGVLPGGRPGGSVVFQGT